jgi:ketosteroid isomerase-like protein
LKLQYLGGDTAIGKETLMTKSVKRWIIAVALLALPALAARADSAADAKKAIQAQYNKCNAAAARKDSKGVTSVYTKDRVAVTSKGVTSSVSDETAQMEQIFQAATSVAVSTTITGISVKGNTAIVNVKEHGKIVLLNPKTMANSNMVEDAISIDTWVKTGGTWLEKKSVEKSVKATLDGKPVSAQ